MQLEKIPLPETNSFSHFFLDYISGAEVLKPFYGEFPLIENFRKQIDSKALFPQGNRDILVDTLQRQYNGLQISDLVRDNISALKSGNTFTVTTGHQLNIFTGPLYFIFKIVTAINTCKALSKKYPSNRFVPVYWMASEDHDFEEISYFRLYGKKYQWKTSQTGAVGRFNPAELNTILKEIPGDISVFADAYKKNKTLSAAVRQYVNTIFGNEGVVVVDADDHALKTLLAPVMKADLFDHIPHQLVTEATNKIQSLGYHTQVNARDINFFFLDNSIRDRLENEGEQFVVVNQNLPKRKDEIIRLIDEAPEKLSPNVVLRPLYQEIILPNLAYIGGPSELVYWLQLKTMFDHFKVPFPILMPRNFGMIMDHTEVRKFEKTGLTLKDFFEDKNFLFNHWTLNNSVNNLTLSPEIAKLKEIFGKIKEQASSIDKTLTQHIEARARQTIHQLEVMEKKMLRAERRKHAEKLAQIEVVKDALFPGGSLQERTDNFLNFQQQHSDFIADLVEGFDPFDYQMHVFKYEK